MKLLSDNFAQGELIPEAYAWGRIGADGQTVRSENRTPSLRWCGVPDGTRSFLIACLDDDVPTDRNERDATGEIPVSQLRRRFVHWVQADVPAVLREIPEGALTEEKKCLPGFGVIGTNDYSRGEALAPGETGTGYDGPCPPCFDARWHYYRFMIFALDAELSLLPGFRWEEAERAMKGHLLASAELVGRYTLNTRLREN